MKKKVCVLLLVMLVMLSGLVACGEYSKEVERTKEAGEELSSNQPTPTDIDYSLERYNLIRRAYWVNGQREKANAIVCAVDKPLGYIVLINGDIVIGTYVVDGKVSSLNSYLTPDMSMPNSDSSSWLPDVDGSYGENDNGIFFFTPDGHYYEWTGTYLYSDTPFIVDDPVIKVVETEE